MSQSTRLTALFRPSVLLSGPSKVVSDKPTLETWSLPTRELLGQ